MFYPKLRNIPLKKHRLTSFGGLVRGERVPENSFSDMKNLSSSSFPVLSVRAPRSIYTAIDFSDTFFNSFSFDGEAVTAAKYVGGHFFLCTENSVFADVKKIEGVELSVSPYYRSIVPFGRNIFIAPDGVYIKSVADGFEVINCGLSAHVENAHVSFLNEKGEHVSPDYIGTLPENAGSGELAVLQNGLSNILYEFTDSWVEKGELFPALICPNTFSGFFPGEKIVFSSDGSFFTKDEYEILEADYNSLLLKGPLLQTGDVSFFAVMKRFPALATCIEFENRLWGAFYGTTANGEFVNEIYASKLGDPTKWYSFEGISTDSFISSVGCSGEFTGSAVLGGELLLFKEDYIIRVGGSNPSDFYIRTFPARGVKKGERESIVNLNEKVFYKSRDGITVFDGGLPFVISGELGNERLSSAVSCAFDGKYYASMKNGEGFRSIYVYDTKNGLWHKEDDDIPTVHMLSVSDNLLFIKKNPEGKYLFCMCTENESLPNLFPLAETFRFTGYEKEKFTWYFESGRLGEGDNPERLKLRSLNLGIIKGEDSVFSVYIKPFSEDAFTRLMTFESKTAGQLNIPVSLPPAESFILRIEGEGSFSLLSLTREYENSSEVKVYGR